MEHFSVCVSVGLAIWLAACVGPNRVPGWKPQLPASTTTPSVGKSAKGRPIGDGPALVCQQPVDSVSSFSGCHWFDAAADVLLVATSEPVFANGTLPAIVPLSNRQSDRPIFRADAGRYRRNQSAQGQVNSVVVLW